MSDVWTSYEHAGVVVEIVHDDDPAINPLTDNDNAGTIYSWTRDFGGDEQIREPDFEIPCDRCDGDGEVEGEECERCGGAGDIEVSLDKWFAYHYDAALTIPLWFSDYGGSGARLYEMDSDPNCAIVFTQAEIDEEWGGYVEKKNENNYGARTYAEARINELDQWFQGNVWGIVIREDTRLEPTEDIENSAGEVLESVWGFIGEPDSKWVRGEADEMAEDASEQIEHEKQEAFRWACADVVTV